MNIKKIYEAIQVALFEAKDIDDFVYIKHLGGSTGSDLYRDRSGRKWVVKGGANVKQLYNEYMANKIYGKFGIHVPESFIGILNGRNVFVMEYLDDSIPLGEIENINGEIRNKVARGFILDVLLANWDVVGTNSDLDNIRVKDGIPYRVDVGGTLTTRAMGGNKIYDGQPSEHKTLMDPSINRNTAKIFSILDKNDIAEQVRDLIKDFVLEGEVNWFQFKKELSSIIFDEDVSISDNDKESILNALVKRATYLYGLFN